MELLLVLLSLILLLLHAPPAASNYPTAAPAPAPAAENAADLDFIKDNCNAATLYPRLCYGSLSSYASAVSRDSAQLARVAIAVSFFEARRAAGHFTNLSLSHDFDEVTGASAAITDCCSTFSDAVDQMRSSFKGMSRLGSGGTALHSLRFQLSNVQTWMSAALTNEDTCLDGFAGVSDGPLKSDVGDRVARARALTSNALALVNSYASKVM